MLEIFGMSHARESRPVLLCQERWYLQLSTQKQRGWRCQQLSTFDPYTKSLTHDVCGKSLMLMLHYLGTEREKLLKNEAT